MSEISSTDSMAALIHATSMRGSRDDLLRTRSSSRSRLGIETKTQTFKSPFGYCFQSCQTFFFNGTYFFSFLSAPELIQLFIRSKDTTFTARIENKEKQSWLGLTKALFYYGNSFSINFYTLFYTL